MLNFPVYGPHSTPAKQHTVLWLTAMSGVHEPSAADENSEAEPQKASNHAQDDAQDPQTPSKNAKRTSSATLQCPICNEPMVSVHQLNRHIDDSHLDTPESTGEREGTVFKNSGAENSPKDIKAWIKKKIPGDTPSLFVPLKRKTLNLDLLDGNRGFGLSDSLNDTSKSPDRNQNLPLERLPVGTVSPRVSKASEITRSHWRQPSINGTLSCSQPGCKRTLNIKSGIVNCRKCGKLFCNEHSRCKVRLRNPVPGEGKLPMYDTSASGVWCRSCELCYMNKPDFAAGVQVVAHDVTAEFLQLRNGFVDKSMLRRIKLQKRFIKNANIIAERFAASSKQPFWSTLTYPVLGNKTDLLMLEQKQIVGFDNWQDDSASHCAICFTAFNMLIRKHHCRLCGRIVCNDPTGERMFCSLLVPITSFIDRLPNLNYAAVVRDNLAKMHNEPTEAQDRISLRCCVDCKNDLLHSWRLSDEVRGDSDRDIFTIYNGILALKSTISSFLPRYRKLVDEIVKSDVEKDRLDLNKARLRLMTVLKDFEGASTRFRTLFLQLEDGMLCIKPEYANHKQLVLNMYQSTIMFLQDNLETFKLLNAKVQEVDQRTIDKMDVNADEQPRLTKREVREMREKLMVMKEQTFIVEQLIESATKQRKFDEIDLLLGNKNELEKEIAVLEDELGDEGF